MPYDPNFISGQTVALPTLGPSLDGVVFNTGGPVEHSRFSIVFHRERCFAVYTAHNIDGVTLIPEGTIPRRDRFRFDPNVNRSLQVDNDRGYKSNPWDRGHLVRRRSMHWGDPEEAETADHESFYWTNIAPQHENLHDTAWGRVEDWMLEVTDGAERRSCVFTGPVLTPTDPERTNAEGERPIRIPAGFWKVIVTVNRGRLVAAAFLVWQRDYDRTEPLAFDPILEQVRVTTIEFLTGLSFASLRDADPLRFGAELDRQDGRTVLRANSARKKSAAVTCATDIFL